VFVFAIAFFGGMSVRQIRRDRQAGGLDVGCTTVCVEGWTSHKESVNNSLSTPCITHVHVDNMRSFKINICLNIGGLFLFFNNFIVVYRVSGTGNRHPIPTDRVPAVAMTSW